ncbi:MAG: complex I NDUFA9 subunit family protein [Magnetococcales bacterium]|nr:complex I NDUFA9 subunit family protein [Magnetococcales bacterium]
MILVTGCTGQVGTSLIRRLLKEGIPPSSIRGLARNPSRTKDPNFPREIDLRQGDVADPSAVRAAMDGVHQVFHLVGILLESRQATFQKIHVEGTRNVVEAAKERKVSRLVMLSSLGTRPNARSRYHQTKWQAEEHVRRSGLAWTLFRPSVIFGPLDDFTNQFAKMVSLSPVVPVPGQGKIRLQPVWVEDVVQCLYQSLNDPTTHGQTLEMGGPEVLTLDEIIDRIQTKLGKTRYRMHIPFPLLTTQAWFLERLLPRPPLTVDQMILAQEDNVTRHPFPWQRFGIAPRALRDGIAEFL